MDKKKLFVLMALVMVLAILGTGTLAYFTTRAITHNVITTGGVGITLLEEFPNAVPGDGENTMELDGVMPGSDYRKAVKVRNDQEEAWIRVRVTVRADQGQDLEAVTAIDFNEGSGATQWTKSGDWYYYNSPVAKGDETSYLFENVTFDGAKMGNEYQNAKLTISVDAQAVQTANNGTQVMEATGWPKN